MAKNDSFLLEGNTNQAVLLCHSLGADPSQMKELAKKLNKKGYTVSCPLYPGHGGTFYDMIATEVSDWYETLAMEYDRLLATYPDIYIIGMSIGGSFTVKLAEEKNPRAIATINAPVIGFDLYTDLYQFTQTESDKEKIKQYRDHRYGYFKFVTELGQIENLKRIECPIFVLQGSQDAMRYKTSSMMLMTYPPNEIKQRKDYAYSRHLLLAEQDRKEAIQDIINFFAEN